MTSEQPLSFGARSRYRLFLTPNRLTITILFHSGVTRSQKSGANLHLKAENQRKSRVLGFVGGMKRSWGAY